jgi:hypothetical protein
VPHDPAGLGVEEHVDYALVPKPINIRRADDGMHLPEVDGVDPQPTAGVVQLTTGARGGLLLCLGDDVTHVVVAGHEVMPEHRFARAVGLGHRGVDEAKALLERGSRRCSAKQAGRRRSTHHESHSLCTTWP